MKTTLPSVSVAPSRRSQRPVITVGRSDCRGFTLVEMGITLLIIGILAAIGAPMFKSLTLNQGIKAGAYDLFSAIEFARSEAVKRNANVLLRAGASADGTWTSGWRLVDPSNNVLRSWNLVSTIKITEPGGAQMLEYGSDGKMTPKTFAAVVTAAPKLQVDAVATVSGVKPRCIQVDLIGRAKIADGACP